MSKPYTNKEKAEEILANTPTHNAPVLPSELLIKEFIRRGEITYDKLSIDELSAITADLGAITAGTVTINSSGFIRGGQTAYDTGNGFWLGYDTAAYKLSLGDSAGNKLLWDGSTLAVTGNISGSIITGGSIDIASTGPVVHYLTVDATGVTALRYAPAGGNFITNSAVLLSLSGSAASTFKLENSTTDITVMSIQRNVSTASNPLIFFGSTNDTSAAIILSISKGAGSGAALSIDNDGTGDGIYVKQDGNGIGIDMLVDVASSNAGIFIRHEGTGHAIGVNCTKATSATEAINIQNFGTGYTAHIEGNSNVNRDKATLYCKGISGQFAPIRLAPQVAAGANPEEGDIYYDTDGHFYGWDGSSWLQLDN